MRATDKNSNLGGMPDFYERKKVRETITEEFDDKGNLGDHELGVPKK